MYYGLFASRSEFHRRQNEGIQGLTCMATGIIKCENSDVLWKCFVEYFNRLSCLLNHFFCIPPTIISLATTVLNEFSGVNSLTLLAIVV